MALPNEPPEPPTDILTAFQEFVEQTGTRYEYIAFSVTGQQVAVRILENPAYSE